MRHHLLGGATCSISIIYPSRGNHRRSTVRLRKDHRKAKKSVVCVTVSAESSGS